MTDVCLLLSYERLSFILIVGAFWRIIRESSLFELYHQRRLYIM